MKGRNFIILGLYFLKGAVLPHLVLWVADSGHFISCTNEYLPNGPASHIFRPEYIEDIQDVAISLDLNDKDVEIAVFSPDASELTEEDEGYDNEVNTSVIIVNDVLGSLEVRTGEMFQP
ncbi:hypothetical protein TNCT_715181 [Trichonephila clavata]|uniref:Uncharacterized protein n=1 Tax=Trichonephila clavata TaxID=2740835 RepID=A0A8X6M5G7_TRICU|nr:hypothetical protein TNCT_715181 [Trichonephila clavata]